MWIMSVCLSMHFNFFCYVYVCALFIWVKKGRGSFRCPERKFGIFNVYYVNISGGLHALLKNIIFTTVDQLLFSSELHSVMFCPGYCMLVLRDVLWVEQNWAESVVHMSPVSRRVRHAMPNWGPTRHTWTAPRRTAWCRAGPASLGWCCTSPFPSPW